MKNWFLIPLTLCNDILQTSERARMRNLHSILIKYDYQPLIIIYYFDRKTVIAIIE